MKNFKVMVTANSFGLQGPESIKILEDSGVEIIHKNRAKPWSEDELLSMVPGIDGLIVGADIITAKVIENADSLKIIAKHGVGLDNIDIKAATEKNIYVTAGIGSNSVAVAELTISLIFAVARKIVSSNIDIKNNIWKKQVGIELTGKTAGIIGLGRIGREVAIRLKGLKMKLLGFDPYCGNEFFEEHRIKKAEVETLAREADIITLHASLIPETKHIINSNILGMMKKNSILINTARGELVDETSLYHALKNKKIYGAAIDAFTEEPPSKSPLPGLSNFIGTPHIGAYTRESINKMSCLAAFSIQDFIKNNIPRNLVNKEVLNKRKGNENNV